MKLTEEQIKILVAIAEGKPVEKNQPEKGWVTQYFSNCSIAMIMEYLTAGNIRIKAPPTLIQLEQKDWVNGPWYIRYNDDDGWQMAMDVLLEYVRTCCGLYSHEELLRRGFKRSRTCLPDSWEVCGKEVKS